MCGIAAIFDPAATLAESTPAAMCDALRHRGPDGDGVHRQGPATLVHTRLAIIDVAGGRQPLSSEDGACSVVVNGEIYNHRELRRELEAAGHRFVTDSDSEVVVHLYEEAGLDGIRRLEGMFAFALWDDRRSRLVLARDPFGIKPLYWWSDGRRLVAASEVTALIAAGVVRPAVDDVALDHLFTWRFVPAPRTLFAGVSKLAAASILTVDPTGPPRVTSFREPPGAVLERTPAAELAAELRTRTVAAVQRQMMSDVPYGAFLSGGLDSAAIVAAMARVADAPAPRTFTIGFPGHDGAIDERADARRTAQLLGSRHTDVAMVREDFPGQVAQCVARLEEPSGIPSAPALLELSRAAAREVKVVLSGQGADEPLGGYPRHQAAALLGPAGAMPRWTARLVQLGARAPSERLARALHVVGETGLDAVLAIFDIGAAGAGDGLPAAARAEAEAERRLLVSDVLSDVGDRDVLDQVLHLDTHLFLPDNLLVYGDKMTMAHGLEQRVPFLDVELMRFVERVPGRTRIRHLRRKWLHRQAMAGLVPAEVIGRPKRPFATPYEEWLRTSLGDEIDRRWTEQPELAEIVDGGTVARLLAEHRSGRADRKRVLYCLLELACWHETFVTGAPPRPAHDEPAGSPA